MSSFNKHCCIPYTSQTGKSPDPSLLSPPTFRHCACPGFNITTRQAQPVKSHHTGQTKTGVMLFHIINCIRSFVRSFFVRSFIHFVHTIIYCINNTGPYWKNNCLTSMCLEKDCSTKNVKKK